VLAICASQPAVLSVPVDAACDRLRAMLGEQRFAAEWDAGHALDPDAAVTEALALGNAVSAGDRTMES
jgi:hypothetical protein